jgi:hypothetical protein
MRAQDGMLDRCGQRGGHGNPGQHGMVQVADHFLQGEGHGRDRGVEGGDPGGRPHREDSAQAPARQRGAPPDQAGDAGADL